MTLKETAVIFEILKAAYPHSFKQIDDPRVTLNLWCSMFENETGQEVASAVKVYLSTDTSGFMPSIGMIKKLIAQSRMANELTEDEAWTRIRQAASNALYNADAEFDSLPDSLKSVVGSPSQLRDWATMDSETFNSVVASNFRKSYRVRIQAKKEQLMIPQSVQQAMKLIGEPK